MNPNIINISTISIDDSDNLMDDSEIFGVLVLTKLDPTRCKNPGCKILVVKNPYQPLHKHEMLFYLLKEFWFVSLCVMHVVCAFESVN